MLPPRPLRWSSRRPTTSCIGIAVTPRRPESEAPARRPPAARVVLWEPPDFQATPVSAELHDRLDRAAAEGDRKRLVRLLLNEVVGVNTGTRIPRLAFPLLFRSPFGRTVLANALAIPTGMRAFEAYDWSAQDLSTLDMPVTFLIGSQSPPFNRRFADSVASRIPHATIEVIDGGSHGTPMEQPDRFAQLHRGDARE